MFETSPDLSVTTVAEIVRLALAPVFLLSGIGAFLNVLASRLSRIVDRSREIEPRLLASRAAEHDRWIADLKVLDRRMSLISWATGFSVTSAILTCLVVILLFAANLVRTPPRHRDCLAVHRLDADNRRRLRDLPHRNDHRGARGPSPFGAVAAYGGRGRLGRLSAAGARHYRCHAHRGRPRALPLLRRRRPDRALQRGRARHEDHRLPQRLCRLAHRRNRPR